MLSGDDRPPPDSVSSAPTSGPPLRSTIPPSVAPELAVTVSDVETVPVGPVTTTGWEPVGTPAGRVKVTFAGDTPMIVAPIPPTVIALVPPRLWPVSETVVGTSRTAMDGEVPVRAGRRSRTSTSVVKRYAVLPSGDSATGLFKLGLVTATVATAACCPTR